MTTQRTTRRRTAAAVLAALPAVALTTAWASWSGRLPERLTTHWDGAGRPDGSADTTVFSAVLLAVAVAAVVAAVPVLWRSRFVRGPAGAAGSVAGGAAGLWFAVVTTALADGGIGWRFLWFAAGAAWGVVVGAVAGRGADRPVATPATVTTPMTLAPGERAVYVATLRSPMLLGATAASAVLVAIAAATVAPAAWPVVALPVLAALLFGEVRVTADRRGLRLTAGLLGVPVRHIPLSDVVAAGTERIEPMAWGGWGYRMTPGRSALVLRAGPGLVLDLRDGRRFAVTMDDPQPAAALLTALRTAA